MPEFLDVDASLRGGHIGSAALQLTAVEGNQELGEEAGIHVSQAIVSDGRRVTAEEGACEAGTFQRLANAARERRFQRTPSR